MFGFDSKILILSAFLTLLLSLALSLGPVVEGKEGKSIVQFVARLKVKSIGKSLSLLLVC